MSLYNVYTPYSLDSLAFTTPSDVEDLNKLPAAIRQSKEVIAQVFLKEHNADGSHRTIEGAITPNSIGGDKLMQHSTDDSRRSISADHIKNKSIIARHLALDSLDGGSLINGTVSVTKLADYAVTNIKLANDSVAGRNILPLSISAKHLAEDSGYGAKLVYETVEGSVLKRGTTKPNRLELEYNSLIVGNPDKRGNAVKLTGLFGLKMNPGEQTAELYIQENRSLLSVASVVEVGTSGGDSTDGLVKQTWLKRVLNPLKSSLKVQYDTNNMIAVSVHGVRVKTKGIFLVFGFAAGYAVGRHQCRLYNATDAQTELVGSLTEADIYTQGQSFSSFMGIVTLTKEDVKLQIQHYVEADQLASGGPPAIYKAQLGRAFDTGIPEEDNIFAQLMLIKLN